MFSYAIFGAALFLIVKSGSVNSRADGQFGKASSWAPKCPSNARKIPRLISNPGNCRSLFICHNGTLQEYFCPEGKVFNSVRQECVKQRICTGNFNDWSPLGSCPKNDRSGPHYFRHPVDCRMFYQCGNGIAYLQRCPSNTSFDTRINACNHEINVDCESGYLYTGRSCEKQR